MKQTVAETKKTQCSGIKRKDNNPKHQNETQCARSTFR